MERPDFAKGIFARMTALYARDGVSTLCLELQDRHGADVVLFLTLFLADGAGIGLSDADFEKVIRGADDWRETVVVPLREIRRRLKPRVAKHEIQAFRERIKGEERAAEKIHAEALADHLATCACLGGPARLANKYLETLNIDPEERRTVLAFLSAAANP